MLADAVVASAEEIALECKRAVARDAQAKLATSNDKRNAAQQRSPGEEARAREEARHGQAVTLSVYVRALFVDDGRGGEETSTDEGCEATTHDETARRQRTTRQR